MIRRLLGLSVVAVLLPVAGLSAQERVQRTTNVFDVTALEYSFQTSRTEIPAGWTTIHFRNKGDKTHHLEFAPLPEGVSHKDFKRAYTAYYGLIDSLNAGAMDSATARKHYKTRVADWFGGLDYRAGAGFLAPGGTSTTTVRLEPGKYVMACFVENPEKKLHFRLGMVRPLTITEESTATSPPDADVTIRLSKYEIETVGKIEPGEQTIAVEFGEREGPMEPPYQDIHLARLEDETSLEEVMEWAKSRVTPAPAEFLGGAPVTPAGQTVYLTVDLSPGQYAWVSYASEAKGMVKTFTVQ